MSLVAERATGLEGIGKVASAIELVRSQYKFRQDSAVRAFVAAHSFLVPILLEAPEQIRRVFGDTVQLELQIESEPDAESDTEELFLLILSSGDFNESRQKLRELDRRWWLAASSPACCRMNIDVEPA
jgi:hypothetical protein